MSGPEVIEHEALLIDEDGRTLSPKRLECIRPRSGPCRYTETGPRWEHEDVPAAGVDEDQEGVCTKMRTELAGAPLH